MGYSRNGTFSNADIDTIETVGEFHVRDNEEMWLSFVVGTANLSDFNVDFRAHIQGSYFTVASVTADYTSPEGPILGASSDLTQAASGATVHWLKLNVKGVESVRIQAAGTSSTITGHWGAN
jgi:hypothetical protein